MPEDPEVRTAAVVLAAGAGHRFEGSDHKLTMRLDDGSTLARRAASVALDADIGPVVVVTGAASVDRLGLPTGCIVLVNHRWDGGQATSLGCAVGWARDAGIGAVVVGLADQPGLTPGAWRAVARAVGTPISVATYDGRRGHPIRLAAEVWADLPVAGDEGARSLIRARPDLVAEVAAHGDPTDVDTASDLAAWLARERGGTT